MEKSDVVTNSRSEPRFVIDDPIPGYFGRVDVLVHDVSEGGMQIGHAEPLRPKLRARVGFRLGDFNVAIDAVVMWCRLSTAANDKGKLLYRSGLKLEDPLKRFSDVINRLAGMRRIRPDDESLDRKRQKIAERRTPKTENPMMKVIMPQRQGVPSDQLLLVQQARERLRASPSDAAAWLVRGRASMQTESGRLQDLNLPHNEEVFAVWEYLERTIDLVMLARAFESK
jgi:hypothetical protein